MEQATLITRIAAVKARPAPVEPNYTGMQWNAAFQARLEHVAACVEHGRNLVNAL